MAIAAQRLLRLIEVKFFAFGEIDNPFVQAEDLQRRQLIDYFGVAL